MASLPHTLSAHDAATNGSQRSRHAESAPVGLLASSSHPRSDSASQAWSIIRHSNPLRRRLPSQSSQLSESLVAPEIRGGELGPLPTAVNLMKCAFGAGAFALPRAFLDAGFALGIGLTFALGALAAATASMLLVAERNASLQRGGERLQYPQLARAVGGARGGALHWVCVVGVVSCSCGICAVYVLFICETLHTICEARLAHGGVAPPSMNELALLTSPAVLALALLRSFRYLVVTSVVGDLAVLLALGATLAVGAYDGAKASPASLPLAQWSNAPNAAGAIAFLFLVHIILLPVAQSFRGDTEREQRKLVPVVWWSYALIATVNAAFAATCVCLFGTDTKPTVILNLSATHRFPSLVLGVQLLLCLDLLVTTPMALAAGREIVEEALVSTRFGMAHETLARNATRTGLVLGVYAIVLGVPSFSDAVDLVGGVCNCLMGLILPPVLYANFHAPSPHAAKLGPLKRLGLGAVVAFGLALLGSSSFFTIRSLLKPADAAVLPVAGY